MKKQALVVVVVLLLGIAGFALYRSASPLMSVEEPDTSDTSEGQEELSGGASTATVTEKDSSLQPADASASAKLPDLNRKIAVYITVPKEVEEGSKKEIQRLTVELRANNELIVEWLTLGIYRKVLGDYKAAEEIWLYVTRRWPSNYVAYNNLGDLYKEYLKDYPKAEKAFKAVIAKKPDYILGYVNLFELYRYFYKEKAEEAPTVLEQGLKANPRSIDLMLRLARYYGDSGLNIEKAKDYYQKAIEESERIGQTAFAAQIKAEMGEMTE